MGGSVAASSSVRKDRRIKPMGDDSISSWPMGEGITIEECTGVFIVVSSFLAAGTDRNGAK
jgi:hypothetical protein